MTSQYLKSIRALAATSLTLAAIMTGCGTQGPEAESLEPSKPQETAVVELDEQSVAHATRMSDEHVRVEIKGTDQSLKFAADFRVSAGNKFVVEYTPSTASAGENISSKPEMAALDLDIDKLPTLDDAIAGAVLIHSQLSRASSDYYDNWGCDLPSRFSSIASCGPKGRCCDIHDACYKKHGCSAGSWTSAPWRKCQILCNAPAVACFTSAIPVGRSECCARGNCGQPR